MYQPRVPAIFSIQEIPCWCSRSKHLKRQEAPQSLISGMATSLWSKSVPKIIIWMKMSSFWFGKHEPYHHWAGQTGSVYVQENIIDGVPQRKNTLDAFTL